MSVQTVNAVRDISALYSFQSLDLHSPDKSFHLLCPPVLSAAFCGLIICNELASLLLRSSHKSFFSPPPGFLCPTRTRFYTYFCVVISLYALKLLIYIRNLYLLINYWQICKLYLLLRLCVDKYHYYA